MFKVVVITGPTASGKSDMAIKLAKQSNAEIICADSMQIYDELLIGTARVTEEQQQGVPHHLLGFLSPRASYSVAMYKRDATECIEEIHSRGKLPIICGGTGLYINSLTYDLKFSAPKSDQAVRAKLEDDYDHSPQAVYEKLRSLNAQACERVHINDKKRVVRALEVALSGQTNYDFRTPNTDYDFNMYAPDIPRDVLYSKINARVDVMMEMGLEEEVRGVYERYGRDIMAFAAIGYKEFLPYFDGEYDKARAVELVKRNSRRYAKRQLTWFRADERIAWINDVKEIL